MQPQRWKKILPLRTKAPAWLCALLLLSQSGSVLAQDGKVYRYRSPDGKITYSNRPPAPGEQAEVVPDRLNSAPGGSPGGASSNQSAASAATPASATAATARRDAAERALRAAEQALVQAQQALAAGAEPQDGERVGGKSGRSRLNSDFFDRQGQLESAVLEAQTRVDQARRQYNEAR